MDMGYVCSMLSMNVYVHTHTYAYTRAVYNLAA